VQLSDQVVLSSLVPGRGQAKKDVYILKMCIYINIYTVRRLNCGKDREVDRLDGMDSLAYGYWHGRSVLSVRDQQG